MSSDVPFFRRRFLCSLCCLVSVLALPFGDGYAQETIKFTPKMLTVDANEGIDLADIDGDGKLDVVAGRNWYAAPDFAPRPLRLISDWNGYVESNGDFCLDVDKDGLVDVVAGSFLPTKVFWFKNPGAKGLKLGQVWKQHELVDTKQSQNEASFLHDIDGDGKPEWITNSWKKENPVVVWEFSVAETVTVSEKGKGKNKKRIEETKREPSLTKHVIGISGNTHGMGFGDINNDGREDVLIATGWYERPEGNIYAKPWAFHADWEDLHASCPMLVRDLNGDGKNDLVWGKGHDYGLYWWQGDGVDESGKLKFKEHVIDDKFSQPHTIHFADLDGDGMDELISGKRVRAHNGNDPGGKDVPCMYFYRWDAESNSFSRSVIDEGHIGTGLQIRTRDLNADGKVDIAVAGKDGTWILFQK
ncbi:MAG: FG-GAP repeat domain-containing protein [Mariniblastus sp.]